MPWYLTLILIIGLALIGIGMWLVIEKKVRFELTAAIGIALCTSVVVSYSIFNLQTDIENAKDEANWREKIQSEEILRHFSPGSHSMTGLDLGAKEIVDSNFKRANLRGAHMRAVKVIGTSFRGARLQGVVFTGATFDSETSFTGADLSGADLRDAKFIGVKIYLAKSLHGAKVNAGTCWPKGFEENHHDLLKDLVAVPKVVYGKKITEKGREIPNCLAGIGGV